MVRMDDGCSNQRLRHTTITETTEVVLRGDAVSCSLRGIVTKGHTQSRRRC